MTKSVPFKIVDCSKLLPSRHLFIWEIEKNFLPSLDALQTHKILAINHGAITEKDWVRVSKIVMYEIVKTY